MSCLFFFQAEDGIRDRDVTGVQTCALPISHSRRCPRRQTSSRHSRGMSARFQYALAMAKLPKLKSAVTFWRSEERRVGKECRSGWGSDHAKKKEHVRRVTDVGWYEWRASQA